MFEGWQRHDSISLSWLPKVSDYMIMDTDICCDSLQNQEVNKDFLNANIIVTKFSYGKTSFRKTFKRTFTAGPPERNSYWGGLKQESSEGSKAGGPGA